MPPSLFLHNIVIYFCGSTKLKCWQPFHSANPWCLLNNDYILEQQSVKNACDCWNKHTFGLVYTYQATPNREVFILEDMAQQDWGLIQRHSNKTICLTDMQTGALPSIILLDLNKHLFNTTAHLTPVEHPQRRTLEVCLKSRRIIAPVYSPGKEDQIRSITIWKLLTR